MLALLPTADLERLVADKAYRLVPRNQEGRFTWAGKPGLVVKEP